MWSRRSSLASPLSPLLSRLSSISAPHSLPPRSRLLSLFLVLFLLVLLCFCPSLSVCLSLSVSLCLSLSVSLARSLCNAHTDEVGIQGTIQPSISRMVRVSCPPPPSLPLQCPSGSYVCMYVYTYVCCSMRLSLLQHRLRVLLLHPSSLPVASVGCSCCAQGVLCYKACSLCLAPCCIRVAMHACFYVRIYM